MKEREIETLIVGAGPAGLAVAGRMSKISLPYTMIEASDKIAKSWHEHYDRLHLHTVSELSHLPHRSFPTNYPRYVPRKSFIKYLQEYARHFKITPVFNKRVVKINRNENGFSIDIETGESFQAKNVVIGTGVNRVPLIPTWHNQDLFTGEILHSRSYKNPDPFSSDRVLVIGMGNTGAEIALDLAEQNIPCILSVRGTVSIVPRDLNGRPTQITAKQLAKIPFGLGDSLGTLIRRIYYGDLTKYGLHSSKMHPAEQLRTTGKTPVIDIGTIKQIKERRIKVIPDIKSFTKDGVIDIDDNNHAIDKVILATGYRARLEDFLYSTAGLLDKFNVPISPIGTGQYKGLYFVGFDNYKLGGILGTIFTDSKTIVDEIAEGTL